MACSRRRIPGFVALLLAIMGLYAVVSYIVAMRSRELAIRMTLGANSRTILTMVLRQAMTMAVSGAVFGGFLAFIICLLLPAGGGVC